MASFPTQLTFTHVRDNPDVDAVFTKNNKLSSARLRENPAALAKLLAREIQAEVGIPASYLTDLGKQFVQPDGLDKLKGGSPFRSDSEAEFLRKVTAPVDRAQRYHFAYYKATLLAMRRVLASPGIAATEAPVTVTKQVVLPLIGAGLNATDAVSLSLTWRGLANSTIEEKKKLRAHPVFWKHTGRGSRAFNAAVEARLASLTKKDFIIQDPVQLSHVKPVKGSLGTHRKQDVAKAQYSFRIGVPAWNSKMDALFTIPFVSGYTVSPAQYSGLDLYERQAYSDNEIAGPRFRYVRKKQVLHGIDRLLAAEASRPLLRPIALQAGQRLRAALHGGAVQITQAPVSPITKLKKATKVAAQRKTDKPLKHALSADFKKILKKLDDMPVDRLLRLERSLKVAESRHIRKGTTDTLKFAQITAALKVVHTKVTPDDVQPKLSDTQKELLSLSRGFFNRARKR